MNRDMPLIKRELGTVLMDWAIYQNRWFIQQQIPKRGPASNQGWELTRIKFILVERDIA